MMTNIHTACLPKPVQCAAALRNYPKKTPSLCRYAQNTKRMHVHNRMARNAHPSTFSSQSSAKSNV